MLSLLSPFQSLIATSPLSQFYICPLSLPNPPSRVFRWPPSTSIIPRFTTSKLVSILPPQHELSSPESLYPFGHQFVDTAIELRTCSRHPSLFATDLCPTCPYRLSRLTIVFTKQRVKEHRNQYQAIPNYKSHPLRYKIHQSSSQNSAVSPRCSR